MDNKQQITKIEEINEKEKQKRKEAKNAFAISNFMYGLTRKIAKDKGLELDTLYDEEWKDYFANYLNGFTRGKFERKITSQKAVEKLNECYIKDIQGAYIPIVQKRRNIIDAIELFDSVCANVRIQIKNKYGVEDYYSLKDSESKEAQEEFCRFEEFAKKGEIKLTQQQLQEHYKSLNNGSVEAMLNQSIVGNVVFGGVLLGAGLAFVPGFFVGAYKDSNFIPFQFAVVGGIVGGIYSAIVESPKAEVRIQEFKLDEFFKNFGFKDRNEAFNYLNDYLQTMSIKDKKELVDALMENEKLTIAHAHGFASVEEAIAAAGEGTEKTITLNEALKLQGEQYTMVKNGVAERYGFKDYNDAMVYVNNHQRFVEKGTYCSTSSEYIGGPRYVYDDPRAFAVMKDMAAIDEKQTIAIKIINGETWPQTVVDYGEYNGMMNEMGAADVVKKVFYQKMIDSENYAYGTDGVANAVYDDFVQEYGVDNANEFAHIPAKQSDMVIGAEQVSSEISGIDFEHIITHVAGGSFLGAVCGGVLKILPGFVGYVQGKKGGKLENMQNEQFAQEQQDQRMMGR